MIVDTNAVSAWRDGDDDLLEVMASARQLALPVIAVGEYRYGIGQSTHRLRAEAWLDTLVQTIRVLAVNLETAHSYAVVRAMLQRKGSPIPANDMWIAALALQHRLPVLSRDAHFDAVDGLTRISW
ncbi:MAG TPA: type II toxin-antitoxin system VapC family toxin [Dehalococcoidia bacterium]|nr:type II toxin-antitoxin system VapC family toxin [Dehalococcoidia bacterium]